MTARRRFFRPALFFVTGFLAATITSCGGGDDAKSTGCLDCHVSIRDPWAEPSSHRLVYDCRMCHPKKAGEPGPGHRDKVDCLACHSEQAHPAATGEGPAFVRCDVCHDPHGSSNLKLIRTAVALPRGGSAAVVFTNLAGYASGSFADPRPAGGEPGRGAGTGLCEVCHTRTLTYRQDGTGEAHEGGACPNCHSHARAFAPP